jgi:hypothetical protein
LARFGIFWSQETFIDAALGTASLPLLFARESLSHQMRMAVPLVLTVERRYCGDVEVALAANLLGFSAATITCSCVSVFATAAE